MTGPIATDQDTMRRIVFHQYEGWQIISPAASNSNGRWHASNDKAHLAAATLDILLDELDWSGAT